MNIMDRLLKGKIILILAVLFYIINVCNACPLPSPDIIIEDWIRYAESGESGYMYAIAVDGSPDIDQWYWEMDGAEFTSHNDWARLSKAYPVSSTPGQHYIEVRGGIYENGQWYYNYDYGYLYVIGAASISADKNYVALGETVTYTVTTNPSGQASHVTTLWKDNGGVIGSSAYTSTFQHTFSTAGVHPITASIGNTTTAAINTTVIDVEITTPSSSTYWAGTTPLQLDCEPLPILTGSTYSWSKVSGPGNVTFSSSMAKNPTFTADQAGDYVVKVEYTKDGVIVSDTSDTITVIDVEITTPSSFPAYWAIGSAPLQLGCTPYGSTTGTYSWSKISGPGDVTFSSSTVQNPTFTASEPGQYLVKIEYTKDGAIASETCYIYAFQVDIFFPSINYTIGSGNINIYYNIFPTGVAFTADTAVLEIRDKDGTLVYSDNDITKTAGGNTATWSGSTTSLRSVHWNKDPYVAKITITKGTKSSSDTMSINIVQSTASIVAETSAKTSLPLTECMEGRTVTFTANAVGFISSTFNLVEFKFWFRDADGTFWYDADWSWDLIQDKATNMDDVLDGDNDHYYDTPVFVDVEDNFGHFITSSYIEIKVWELWIEYFRDAVTDNAWKVCVGDPIEYSAISSPDCTNWSWDMPECYLLSEAWNPTGGNMKTGNAMQIPYSDLPGKIGNCFGTQYGKVRVFCKDEEGNNHTFYSTSMNSSDFPAGWVGEKKAKVYFKPELNTNGTAPDQDHPPCWYLFWQNCAVTDLEDFEYKHQNWYGESQVIEGFFFDRHILRVGYMAGPTLVAGNIVGGTHYPGGLLINGIQFGGAIGIDCCTEVVVHEKYHNTLADEINDGATDNDPATPLFNHLGDWLPDNREAALGCNVNNKDTFNLAGLKHPDYGGYGDNEYTVMIEARGKTGDSTKDWSKGGKQW